MILLDGNLLIITLLYHVSMHLHENDVIMCLIVFMQNRYL